MRILVFRMSSLGDLILSTAFLENLPEGALVDWVVSSDFAFVLRGHPKIRSLVVFDKKTGLPGWFRLIRSLAKEPYDFRVDLHRTLRTRMAGLMFPLLARGHARSVQSLSISKQRFRTFLVLLLKRWLPEAWKPTPYWERFARIGRMISGSEGALRKPSYLPILENSGLLEEQVLESIGLQKGTYFCVMPASRWKSKEWDPRSFAKLSERLGKRGLIPVLLGREKDGACIETRRHLLDSGISHRSLLQEPDFRVSAVILKNSSFFVGCDTGLSHLAEAVGGRAHVLFGPTRPEIGFGPCREGSRSIGTRIGCAPCSKSGKHCYRFWSPHECMKTLRPETVEREIFS